MRNLRHFYAYLPITFAICGVRCGVRRSDRRNGNQTRPNADDARMSSQTGEPPFVPWTKKDANSERHRPLQDLDLAGVIANEEQIDCHA